MKIGTVLRLKNPEMPYQTDLRYTVTGIHDDGKIDVVLYYAEGGKHLYTCQELSDFEATTPMGVMPLRADVQQETIHCANCEAEAVKCVVHDDDSKTPLCCTCATAYRWGQSSPRADIVELEYADYRPI